MEYRDPSIAEEGDNSDNRKVKGDDYGPNINTLLKALLSGEKVTLGAKQLEDGSYALNVYMKGLELTTEQVNLNTDGLEGLLTTLTENPTGTETDPVNIEAPASKQVSVTIANTIDNYSGLSTAPVCIGIPVNLTGAMRKVNGTGIFQSLLFVDSNNKKPPVIILLFNSQPSNGTYANKNAPTYGADVPGKLIRAISINSSDYVEIGDGKSVVDLSPGSRMLTGDSVNGDIYAQIITPASVTFTAANALTFKAGLMRD